MARLQDKLKKKGQEAVKKAADTAAQKSGQASGASNKQTQEKKKQTPARSVQTGIKTKGQAVSQKAKETGKQAKGVPTVKNAAKKAASKAEGTKKVQQYKKDEKTAQRFFNQENFARDLVSRQNVRAQNFAKSGTVIGKKIDNPTYNQMVDDEILKLKLSGKYPEKATFGDVIKSTTLDPLSAMKADATSKANYGRGVGVTIKQPERTDADILKDATANLKERTRQRGAKQQNLSRYDNRLSQQFRDEIRLAKQDYETAKRKGDAKGMEEAHQRAETWRRIEGGFSGGEAGNEYIRPEISQEDIQNLNKEGITRLASAKLGWENATTDEERAKYARMGQDIRKDPTVQKGEYDRGAYRNQSGEGRMMYGGTEEERQEEKEQLEAIPLAGLTGIAGAFGTIPGTTYRAMQTDAARNQDYLQNLSDIRGGGEVNISEPEQRRTAQEILGDLYRNDYYQNASPLLKTKKLARAMKEIRDEIPASQRLLNKSKQYTEKALEGQTGLERYLTEAIINGEKMAPGVLAAIFTGGAALPSLIPLFAQTAGEEMGTQELQGKDALESWNRGIVKGATETIPEALPWLNALRIAKGTSDPFVRALGKQLVENIASDEVSEFLGYEADKRIFGDEDASLTAKDLGDTAAVSALMAVMMGTGAGVVGNSRAGGRTQTPQQQRQEQRRTAIMDQATPTVDALAEQEKGIQDQIATWKMQATRLIERLQNSTNDPTWHKHLLNELAQHQAQGEQLKQQLTALEMQKSQRTQIEQQKAEQAEQAQKEAEERAKAEAQATLQTPPQAAPQQTPTQEAVQLAPQVTEPVRAQESADGREMAEEWNPRSQVYKAKPKTALGEFKEKLDSVVAGKAKKSDAPLDEITGYIKNAKDPEEANLLNRLVEAYKKVEYAEWEYDYAEGESVFTASEKFKAAKANYEAVAREAEEWEQTRPQQSQSQAQPRAEEEPSQSFQTKDEEAAYLRRRAEDLIARRDHAENGTPEDRAQWNREWEQLQADIQDAQERWSVGAAPGGFDPLSNWQLSTDQFHPINPKAQEAEAENWGRAPVDIPVRDPFGQLTSKTASTLINAGMTPNEISEALTNMAMNGQLSRIPYTDDAAVAEAERIIEENGYQRAKENWLADVKAGKMSKDLTTMGIVLYNNAANSGHIVEAMDIATDMIEYGKTAGQVLQAVNIINKLGPTGKLYALSNSLEKLENKIRENQKKDAEHWDGITIPEDLGKQYLEAETEEERLAIEKEIKKAVAQQIPNTLKDKLDAWRYMAMLGNPRTQIRNIVGNLGFQPVRIMKNMLGAGLERIAGIDPSQRTKALTFKGLSKADKARYDAGLDEYDSVESIIMGNGKYNDTFSDIDEYRKIFKFKPFEKWRELTNLGLEKGDVFFAKRTYADSFAGILKARGITAEQYTSPTFDPKLKEQIQAISIEEAQKATYRDLNEFSEFVSGLGKRRDTKLRNVSHYLVEGLLPFKKTPANILMRGLEYSPAGLIKGITDMGTKVKNGEMTAAQGIDELASGLTGTGLLGLGIALGLSGIVTPGADEDEKQDKFNQLQGEQNYALNLPGGYSFTLDWMAPEAIPFFMGVELQNGLQEYLAGDKGKDVVWSAARRVTDPMLEMSMLQGVNDLLENLSYSDNKMASILSTLATGYLSQFIPTIGGQLERTLEDRRYSTWIDKDSPIPREIQYLIGKNLNKIPGVDYNQREYVNAWGEPEMTGNPALRAFSNFLSPGYIKKKTGGAVEEELQRLYALGFTDVFPSIEKTSSKINNEPVTMEQFNTLQRVKGQMMKEFYEQTINSEEYKELSDADKAKVLNRLADYSKSMGQVAAGRPEDTLDAWEKNTSTLSESLGIGVAALLEASGMAQAINAHEEDTPLNKALKFYGYMDKKGYSEEQQDAIQEAYFESNAKTRGYVNAIRQGKISQETVEKILAAGAQYDEKGNGLDQAETVKTLTNMKDISDADKAAFYEANGWSTSYEDAIANQKKAEEKAAKFAAIPADKLSQFEEAGKTQNQGSSRWSYDDLYYTAMSVDATDAEREAWYNAQKPANYNKTWSQVKKMAHEAR